MHTSIGTFASAKINYYDSYYRGRMRKKSLQNGKVGLATSFEMKEAVMHLRSDYAKNAVLI